jgi:twinkle protein
VEGEIDCLSYIQAGIDNVISVPNGATLHKQNLTYLDNCIDYFADDAKIYLALDNDAAGNALRDELARRLGTERCYKVYFDDCKDANESLVRLGIHSLIKSLSDAKEYPLTGIFTASQLNEEIDDYYLNGLPQGIGIGIKDFDALLKFHLGYITTITGIPSHGKSEVLDFIMTKLNINGGWKFGIYSPENYPLQLHFSKFAEKLIGKPFSGLGRMLPMELNLAKQHFEDNFFFIKPEQDFSLENILDSVRKLIKRKGINAFVIDAWNKLDHQYTQTFIPYRAARIFTTKPQTE